MNGSKIVIPKELAGIIREASRAAQGTTTEAQYQVSQVKRKKTITRTNMLI